jgi:hypothetical protein
MSAFDPSAFSAPGETSASEWAPQPPPLPSPPTAYAPGPGWWLASDGNWYPPQSAPSVTVQRTNGMAIASMVLGILWLYWVGSILALVFGYIAKSQIKQSRGAEGGAGMATAGIVLGWIGVGVIGLVVFIAFIGAAAGGA